MQYKKITFNKSSTTRTTFWRFLRQRTVGFLGVSADASTSPPPELFGGAIVHDGVQAGVDARQAQRPRVAPQHLLPHAAPQGAHLGQEVQGKGHVVRDKAHQEHHQTAHHQLHGPPLLPPVM